MATYVDIRQPKGGSSRSLKRHLALGLGFFTLLLSAGLSFLVEHLAAESSIRQIGIQLAERAAETRDRFDVGIYERLRDVRVMIAGHAGATPMRRAQLEELQRDRPTFAWVAYVDASGRVAAAARGVLEGADVSQLDWFRKALKGPVVQDLDEDELWRQHTRKEAGEPLRFVAVAAPILNSSGQAAGVLAVYLDWDAVSELRKLGGDTTAFVLSRDGRILHGLPALEGRKLDLQAAAQATAAQAVWLRERWPDGDYYLTAASVTRGYGDYAGLGWKVVLRQDPGEALAEVGRMQLQIIASGVLLGIVFAALAWWFAAHVARPLEAIAESADRLGAGERDLSIPSVHGYREIEHLSASLRAMLSNLRRQEEDIVQARDKLELRVRERTAELTRTRGDLEATVIEREKAQAELAREKERVDLALEAAGVAAWTYELATGRLEFSGQWAAILGGARGITLTTMADLTALVPERERAAVEQAITDAVSGVKTEYAVRHHVQRAGGELLLMESRGKVIERAANGTAVRMAGTIRTINSA